MKLNKRSKNHFLGMQLLASNGKAALFTDSNLDTIPCDIGVEELEELSSSRFLTPDRVSYVKKEVQPSSDSIMILGSVPTKELASSVFGIFLNFNLVFEYHADTTVSDLVSLFDPNIKNIIKDYNIEDPILTDVGSEQAFVSKLVSFFSIAKKNCARDFLARNINKIQRTSIVDESYRNQDNVIFFVKFPNVRYHKKYNQYYIYKNDQDFNGLVFNIGTYSMKEVDVSAQRKAIDADSVSMLLRDKELYLHYNDSASYADTYALTQYTDIVNFCMKKANSITFCEKEFYKQKDIDFDKFNYRLSARIPEASSLFIDLLNNFPHSTSFSYSTYCGLITRNIAGYVHSFTETAQNVKDAKNKFTVNLRGDIKKKSSTLNLVGNSKVLSEKTFCGRYSVQVYKFPYFGNHTHAVNVQKQVLSYVKTITDQQRSDINRKCNFLYDTFTNKNSGHEFKTPYASFFAPRNIQKFTHFTSSVTTNCYTEAIEFLEALGSIMSIAILSNESTAKAIQKHREDLVVHGMQSFEGLDCFNSFENNRLPAVVERIQYSNFKHLLSKSSKKKEIKDSISAPFIKNYSKNNLSDFFIDDNYYNSISNSTPLSLSEDTNFDFTGNCDNSKLFNECFRVAFFGRSSKKDNKSTTLSKEVMYSVVDFLGIEEKELQNPTPELIELFQVSVSMVSIILLTFLYPDFRIRRNYYGAPIEFINLLNKFKSNQIDVPISIVNYKTIGSFLNSGHTRTTIANDFDRLINSIATDDEALEFRQYVRFADDAGKTQHGIISLPHSFYSQYFSAACYNGRANLAPVFNPRSKQEIPSFFARNLLGVNLWYNNMQCLTIYKK